MRQTASDAWISLGNERNDWFVVDHGALERCKSWGERSQCPRTVLFIGHEVKTRALRAIFPFNNHNRRKRDSFTNLVRDSLTSDSERPILFSELNLIRPKPSLSDGRRRYPLEWVDRAEQKPTEDEIYDTLIARVILPFYDVVCLFADDFRNHEHVALYLMRWAQKAHPSMTLNRPRLIVFSNSQFTLNQLPEYPSLFSNVSVSIQVQSNELSYTAQLAKAMKEFNPVNEGFVSHLRELIRVQRSQTEVTDAIIIKLIASAIILDGYPVGAHSKSPTITPLPDCKEELTKSCLGFDPRYLFQSVYRMLCLEAFEYTSTSWEIQGQARCTLLEWEISTILERMEERGMSAAESHETVIKEFGKHCSALKSNRACFCCLQRKPEHVLSCGHAVCDTCVRIFGTRLSSREYHYRMSSCIFCGRVSLLLVKQVPPTAFARALAVDGGGVGGAFSLEALKAIEIAMKHPYLLQDEFDYAIGTSSGKQAFLVACSCSNSKQVAS